VFTARRTGLGDSRSMVAAAWDLAQIEAEYEMFLASFRGQAPADVLVRHIELVHAWRRFPSIDPALPAELLPARWSGARAARLFTERRELWLDDARREWKRLNSVLSGGPRSVAGRGAMALRVFAVAHPAGITTLAMSRRVRPGAGGRPSHLASMAR
jgi:DNA-binding transcriptional regulator PaaX